MASENVALIQPRILLRILVFVVLVAAAFALGMLNRDMLSDYNQRQRMVAGRKILLEEQKALEKAHRLLSRYFVDLDETSDPEAVRTVFMSEMLRLLQETGNKANSYASETRETDGEVLFTYTLSAFGTFGDLMAFMDRLHKDVKPVRMKTYRLSKTGSEGVRADMQLEIMTRR